MPPKSTWEKIGGALDYARSLLPVALEAAEHVYGKLRMDKLELLLTVGAKDPADAAAADLLFAVQLPEPELTAEEQNGRLAIAGATYGAIREIVFSEEEWERRMNRRA